MNRDHIHVNIIRKYIAFANDMHKQVQDNIPV